MTATLDAKLAKLSNARDNWESIGIEPESPEAIAGNREAAKRDFAELVDQLGYEFFDGGDRSNRLQSICEFLAKKIEF